MMRTLLALLFVVACGKSDDKTKSAPQPATGTPAGKPEKTIKGTVTLGGALTTSVHWQPDLAFTCACINESSWSVDATYTDGADTFVALDINFSKGLTLSSGKLRGSLHSNGLAGVTVSCKPDGRNADGVITVDLDAKVTGEAGEVTVKSHLDVVCREGL